MSRKSDSLKRLWRRFSIAVRDFFKFRTTKSLLLLLGIVLVLSLIWLIPTLEVNPYKDDLSPKDRIQAINDTRRTWAQVFGIFGGIALLYLTWRRIEISQEGQITERFTRAIDQLGGVNKKGKKVLEIRLGGIYALERIARDSKKDHWTIMEILTTYVRENSPITEEVIKSDKEQSHNEPPPSHSIMHQPDIQAILTLVGRRNLSHEKNENYCLNIEGANLHGADLRGANLQKVWMRGTNLRGACLDKANLHLPARKSDVLKVLFYQIRHLPLSEGNHFFQSELSHPQAFFLSYANHRLWSSYRVHGHREE